MAPLTFPVNIRDAKPNEFRVLGELWAMALADNDLFKVLWSNADPEAMQKYVWEGPVADAVASGKDQVRVLERTDTSEVMGVIWFYTVSKDRLDKKEPQRERPEGFNHAELPKVTVPTRKFQEALLERYEEFVYVEEFAIAPSYQSQGFRKLLLQHVIASAKGKGLTVALTAAAGKHGFYEKSNFTKMGEPFMFGPDDSLEGPTPP